MSLIIIRQFYQNFNVQKKLQALLVTMWYNILIFGPIFCVIFSIWVTFCTMYYYFMILYFVWIYMDRKTASTGGRRIECIRNWKCWNLYRDYFPVQLIKTEDLSSDRNYLFCIFPHGVCGLGVVCNLATNSTNFQNTFPGLVPSVLTLGHFFMTPFMRELMLGLGFLNVSEESILHVLQNSRGGKALCIFPGGVEEAPKSRPGTYIINLKRRRGFVRLALKTGTPIVPVFSFGETNVFDQSDWLQNLIKKVTGRLLCFPAQIKPKRCPLSTVVGKPIEMPKVDHPTNELIDEYHKKFTASLVKLFEEHKNIYEDNPETIKLLIE